MFRARLCRYTERCITRVYPLKRKLLSLKCGQHEKLEDFFLKYYTIITDLRNVDSKMDESDKICHLLLAMHEKYNAVITAIETVTISR